MFDLNRWPIVQRIGRRFRSNLYILVYDTNRRPIINMIGVAVNRLVGMGLKGCESANVRTSEGSVCLLFGVYYSGFPQRLENLENGHGT